MNNIIDITEILEQKKRNQPIEYHFEYPEINFEWKIFQPKLVFDQVSIYYNGEKIV